MTEGRSSADAPALARPSFPRASRHRESLWPEIDDLVLRPSALAMSQRQPDLDGLEYDGVTFGVAGRRIIGRSARVTPTKNGLFVALWRRASDGGTRPLAESDPFDVVAVATRDAAGFGAFIFSKADLRTHGVVSGGPSVGKRGFRVYPAWVTPQSRQAERTQSWQLHSFLDLGGAAAADPTRTRQLFEV